jgi:ribosome-binding protein aMBF1 (putative translation factor)
MIHCELCGTAIRLNESRTFDEMTLCRDCFDIEASAYQ